jgi:RNA 2',3'-cyclic 3'-phosphodiesterase
MGAASLRVFFAFWPESSLRDVLAELAGKVASETEGRAATGDKLHLTVAFLGEQPDSSIADLQDLAERTGGAAFELALDEIGCFRRSGIAWLGSSSAQPRLLAFHAELSRALRERGFPVDDRPYAPHLTLARRARRYVQYHLPKPIFWRVTSFVLVASELGRAGPSYRCLAEWQLAPP